MRFDLLWEYKWEISENKDIVSVTDLQKRIVIQTIWLSFHPKRNSNLICSRRITKRALYPDPSHLLAKPDASSVIPTHLPYRWA